MLVQEVPERPIVAAKLKQLAVREQGQYPTDGQWKQHGFLREDGVSIGLEAERARSRSARTVHAPGEWMWRRILQR